MLPHILVVEDEQHLGGGIKYNLEAESFRVTLVEDGPTVLRLVESAPDTYDLIVLDLMMRWPGIRQLAKKARGESCWSTRNRSPAI